MAKAHRIQVSFSENDYRLIKRLSELQGESMSSVVGDLFDSVSPVLMRVCVVLEAAQKAKVESREGIKKQAEKAELALQPLIAEALDQFDMFAGVVEAAAESLPVPKARKRTPKAAQPPHSNTGVRSTKAPILKVPKVTQKAKPSTARRGAHQ